MERKLIFNKKDILDLIQATYGGDVSRARITYSPGNQMESEDLRIEVTDNLEYNPLKPLLRDPAIMEHE